jgi:hypothetical protein
MNSRDQKPSRKTENINENKEEGMATHVFAPHRHSLAGMTKAEKDRLQLQVADYIQGMCIDLRAMAHAAELEGLAYFIDMARLEASIQVENRKDKGGSG